MVDDTTVEEVTQQIKTLQAANPNITLRELCQRTDRKLYWLYRYIKIPLVRQNKDKTVGTLRVVRRRYGNIVVVGKPFLKAAGLVKERLIKVAVVEGKIVLEKIDG